MTITEILLIGVALSMDAFAVSAVTGMSIKNINLRQILLLACAFGGFQGIMPLTGYFTGNLFTAFMNTWAPYIACALLVMVGGNMIRETFAGDEEAISAITLKLVLIQAVATSIDALAVGVGMAAAGNVNIWQAAGLIAATTFTLTIVAVKVGQLLGAALAEKAGLLGGVILIVIGIKMLF